jgi:hypothetical protein
MASRFITSRRTREIVTEALRCTFQEERQRIGVHLDGIARCHFMPWPWVVSTEADEEACERGRFCFSIAECIGGEERKAQTRQRCCM